MAGVAAFMSTLAALYHTENTGEGQQVDIAIADAIETAILVNPAM